MSQHEEFRILVLILAVILEVIKGRPRLVDVDRSGEPRSRVGVVDAVTTILALGCEVVAAAPLLVNATTPGSGIVVAIQQPMDGQCASEDGLRVLSPGEDRWPGIKEDPLGGIFKFGETQFLTLPDHAATICSYLNEYRQLSTVETRLDLSLKFSQHLVSSSWKKIHRRFLGWPSRGLMFHLAQFSDADIESATLKHDWSRELLDPQLSDFLGILLGGGAGDETLEVILSFKAPTV